jgi:hypothetical protein
MGRPVMGYSKKQKNSKKITQVNLHMYAYKSEYKFIHKQAINGLAPSLGQ